MEQALHHAARIAQRNNEFPGLSARGGLQKSLVTLLRLLTFLLEQRHAEPGCDHDSPRLLLVLPTSKHFRAPDYLSCQLILFQRIHDQITRIEHNGTYPKLFCPSGAE